MHCGKSDSFRSSEQSTSNLSAVAVSSERAISQTVPHCFMFDFEQLNDLSLEKHHREIIVSVLHRQSLKWVSSMASTQS